MGALQVSRAEHRNAPGPGVGASGPPGGAGRARSGPQAARGIGGGWSGFRSNPPGFREGLS